MRIVRLARRWSSLIPATHTRAELHCRARVGAQLSCQMPCCPWPTFHCSLSARRSLLVPYRTWACALWSTFVARDKGLTAVPSPSIIQLRNHSAHPCFASSFHSCKYSFPFIGPSILPSFQLPFFAGTTRVTKGVNFSRAIVSQTT